MPITVNWSDLEIAFERNSPDQESFLDLENGDLLSIVEGEPDAAARRARVASNPERYLRIDPASSREQYRWMERFVSSVVRSAAARAVADRDRRQGRVPPLQGRAAGVPGRARALVRVPVGAAALPYPDLARPHEDRGGEPAALGPRGAAGRAGRDPARRSVGRGAGRDPAPAGARSARRDPGGRAAAGARVPRVPARSRAELAARRVRRRRAARRRWTTTTTTTTTITAPNPPTPPARPDPPSPACAAWREGRVRASLRRRTLREDQPSAAVFFCAVDAAAIGGVQIQPSRSRSAVSRAVVHRGQRPAVARPQVAGERADHRLEQVIALDAELPPDAGTESQLGGQRFEDARARFALAHVLLERRSQPERDQRRLRIHLDQVLVQRETIGERAHEVRGARRQRPGSLTEAFARGDADAARQVDLGRALRVGRDRRLAPPGVPADSWRVTVLARLRRFGGERAHLDHGRIDARLLPGADRHRAAQARGQRQRRIDAEQRLVAIGADGIEQCRVVERSRAGARRDIDDRRGRPSTRSVASAVFFPLPPPRSTPRTWLNLRCTPWSACGIPSGTSRRRDVVRVL